jgi:acid phosphatase type 7
MGARRVTNLSRPAQSQRYMRLRLVIPLIVVLAGGAASSGSAPAAERQQSATSISATADAYVSSRARRRNFGRARILAVGNGARAYIRFDLTRVDGTVTRAVLRLYSRGRSARGFAVKTTSAGWNERRITFANAPRPGPTVASSGRVAGGWKEIDVTSAVRPGSRISFALVGGRSVRVFSRESGARRPRLVLDVGPPPTLVAAGDIADPGSGAAQTAALLDQIPGTVAALGDLAYENGSGSDFATYYAPTWGRHYARTRPAPGNHEYQTPGAAGYFGYWRAIAGDPSKGYYSYDLGAWHVLSLNSNCEFIGGCGAGSAQETWLRADLAAHPARCTLAYWHHPRFSGGDVGGSSSTQPLWQALFDGGADLVLVAHAHNYQRFAPMNGSGAADAQRGIRQFVVGTGGRSMFHATGPATNLEVANSGTFGVLKLTLRSSGYDWQFVPVAGQAFNDSGSTACH